MSNLKDKAKNLIHAIEGKLPFSMNQTTEEEKHNVNEKVDQTKNHAKHMKSKAKSKAIEGKEHAETLKDQTKIKMEHTKDKAKNKAAQITEHAKALKHTAKAKTHETKEHVNEWLVLNNKIEQSSKQIDK